ncbi:tRNA intron endonuclease [Mrakia frigida]|uniref:tRNA intron endonuclease n=1 Tax=Mrakia frigida TaxID=29902 RepID=UPI003FCC1597
MEDHPSYQTLEPFLLSSPTYAGPLFIVYNDLTLSQKWHTVTPLAMQSSDIASSSNPTGTRPFLMAYRKEEERPRVIVPISLSESLSPKWFRTHFSTLLSNPSYLSAFPSHSSTASESTAPGVEGETDPPVMYTAIVGKDSSVVYYRVAKGIEKPHDVPE